MFTEKKPRLRIAVPVALPSLVQTRSMQGSSETDVSEFMVAPKSSPLHSVAMTATPGCKGCHDRPELLGIDGDTAQNRAAGYLAPGDEIVCVHVARVSQDPMSEQS